MAAVLTEYVRELGAPPAYPSFEPETDELGAEEDRNLRELDALASGAVQKGVVEAGTGEARPQEGDLVYIHLSVRGAGGEVLESTRGEEGGSGVPRAFVLGKGRRAPRGWELALQDMRRGERAILRLRPDLSYAQPGCTLAPPAGQPPDAAFVLDVQLLTWYGKDAVRAVGEAGDVFKRTVEAPDDWETPRPPFEVEVEVKARVPSSDGAQGAGQPYFSTPVGTPLAFTVGDGTVPVALEEAVRSLTKGEWAFFSCSVAREAGSAAPAGGPWERVAPPPLGCERIEYELRLLGMLQVRDLVGDGSVTKRREREGRGQFPVDCPLDDNAVRAHFTAASAATGQVVYDSRGADGRAPPLHFDTGLDAVPQAVDMAVRLMTPGELALVRAAAPYAYAGRAEQPPGLKPEEAVEFRIELVDFDRQPTWAAMSGAEKVARGELLKEQGNSVFKLGPSHFGFAQQKWRKALKIVDQAFELDTQEEMDAASQLKVGCLLNLALVAQREGKYTECFGWCDKALREVADHPKALYRRGVTHALLGNRAEAEADLRLVARLDPSAQREVDKQLALLRARGKAAAEKQKKEFGSFFPRKKDEQQ